MFELSWPLKPRNKWLLLTCFMTNSLWKNKFDDRSSKNWQIIITIQVIPIPCLFRFLFDTKWKQILSLWFVLRHGPISLMPNILFIFEAKLDCGSIFEKGIAHKLIII